MLNERLDYYKCLVENELEKYLSETSCLQNNVIKAARHSLKAGGKRIRPVLVMEFCRICGGDPMNALPVACAIEMIHTFSLIHDDLPCMDDDDLRRGQPSCHKAFGEAIAVLAGDALAIYPSELIANSAIDGKISFKAAVEIISLLSKKSGIFGMIGGQVIDIENESRSINENMLMEMYRLKTSALIEFSCKAGCLAAEADCEKQEQAEKYAEKLGKAFQIIDDILDIEGDEKILGKTIGSDKNSNKTTYVTLFGMEKAREAADCLTTDALQILNKFDDSEFLQELTKILLKRNK